MSQKLLVIQRDTEEELMKAVKKKLKNSEFRMVSLSVLRWSEGYEAWIITEDHAIAGFE